MRTTVDLTPDAYHLAKAYAEAHHVSMGKAISQIILTRRPSSAAPLESEAGFPQFRANQVVTSEMVARMLG